ncbi:hypothetical protein [Actinocrispum sp. NPDC049592]|uniref:hypothetical protein n=1 Tax=Actinocrispum sp. NPDC049592 TaxID=3154835 RepID=UPI00341F6CC1
MSESERLIKELFGTATHCAFPGCLEKLIVADRGLTTVNVHMAHIRSPKFDGPRHDKDYPPELIHKAPNRLLLCTKHHNLVDTSASAYSITELESWKAGSVTRPPTGTAARFSMVLRRRRFSGSTKIRAPHRERPGI